MVMELFHILIVVVITQIYTGDKMTWNYTHSLYRCQSPDFDTKL